MPSSHHDLWIAYYNLKDEQEQKAAKKANRKSKGKTGGGF